MIDAYRIFHAEYFLSCLGDLMPGFVGRGFGLIPFYGILLEQKARIISLNITEAVIEETWVGS
jgi:hypothetical protein